MNSNLAPDITPFVIAFAIIDAVIVLMLLGLTVTSGVGFLRRHRTSRRAAGVPVLHYYRKLALGR